MSNESELTGEDIKLQIDALRKEWDRLDANGSQTERQATITGSIESWQEKLKELTGEDY